MSPETAVILEALVEAIDSLASAARDSWMGIICELFAQGGNRFSPGQTAANARLIAAAPDLLAALRAFVAEATDYHRTCGHGQPGAAAECDSICECIPAGEAAIAKAEGRS